jgi:hypothetical protein
MVTMPEYVTHDLNLYCEMLEIPWIKVAGMAEIV